AWNAIVIMSVMSLKCSAKSAGTPYGFSMCGSIWELSRSAFSICRSTSRMEERYSSSLRRSVGPRLVSGLLVASGPESREVGRGVRLPRLRRRAENHAVAEQTFEQRARVENRRKRLRLAAPREVVRVRAGITGIAIAALAGVFQTDFERRKPRSLT